MIDRTSETHLKNNSIEIRELDKLKLNLGPTVGEHVSPLPLAQTNEGKVLPVCYRCTKVPKEGLYDGFRVQGMFFCSNCQQELFSAEKGSPEYQEFLFLIKGLLYQ